jgi:hypothetical protein
MSAELHAEFTAASREFTNAESRPQGVTPSPVALPIFIASIAFTTLALSILRLRAIRYSSTIRFEKRSDEESRPTFFFDLSLHSAMCATSSLKLLLATLGYGWRRRRHPLVSLEYGRA